VVYNRPKGTGVIEAILDSGEMLNVENAIKVPKPPPKKRKVQFVDPPVMIGDECSESLECPVPRPENGNKNENRCRVIMEKIFGKPFPSVRPKWLKNPATRRNLELDMYCHSIELPGFKKPIRLAVEYDGKQHTMLTKFHNSPKDLIY